MRGPSHVTNQRLTRVVDLISLGRRPVPLSLLMGAVRRARWRSFKLLGRRSGEIELLAPRAQIQFRTESNSGTTTASRAGGR